MAALSRGSVEVPSLPNSHRLGIGYETHLT
jgi:hypothetical protein